MNGAIKPYTGKIYCLDKIFVHNNRQCLKAVTDIRLTVLHFKLVGQLPNYTKREVSSIVFDKLRRENFTNFSRMTAVNHCFTPSSGAIQGPTKRLWPCAFKHASNPLTLCKRIICFFFHSGSLFCAYGILNIFSMFIGAMIFNNVYESTLGIGFNGLVFVLNAALKIFPLVIIR